MTDRFPLSYSKINTYQTCQRKYYWEYVRRIQPMARRMALEFGGAWHRAMEVWHTEHTLPKAIEAFNADFTDGQDKKRTRATAAMMLRRYSEHYKHETFEVIANEQWLEVPLGANFNYVMRIDKVVKDDEGVKGLEHKTTSRLGYQYIKSFKPSLQLTGYVYGLRATTDTNVTQMLIDAAMVTDKEPRAGEGERFLRYPERVDVWELKEFEKIAITIGNEMATRAFEGDEFGQYTPNWGACTLYGECAFRPLCMAPPEVREKIIELQYQPREERPHASH